MGKTLRRGSEKGVPLKPHVRSSLTSAIGHAAGADARNRPRVLGLRRSGTVSKRRTAELAMVISGKIGRFLT